MLRLSVDHDASVDEDEVEASWSEEIASRIDDILAGKADLVDANETYRILSAELDSRRK